MNIVEIPLLLGFFTLHVRVDHGMQPWDSHYAPVPGDTVIIILVDIPVSLAYFSQGQPSTRTLRSWPILIHLRIKNHQNVPLEDNRLERMAANKERRVRVS